MNGFHLSAKVKRMFLDRPEIVRQMGKKKLKMLRTAGGGLRLRARRSLRRRKQKSSPGATPSVHSTDAYATLKNILFALDGPETVIVGPVGFKPRQPRGYRLGPGDVVERLELGGSFRRTVRVRPPRKSGRKLQGAAKEKFLQLVAAGRIQRQVEMKTETVKIEARPFMGPSLVAASRDYPSLFTRGPGE